LLALNYAVRLQRSGYMDMALCGAVEEFSVQRSWLEWHSKGPASGRPLGEGCAVFLLEPLATARRHGREPVAYAPVLEFGVFGEHVSPHAALARCVRAAMKRAGLSNDEVWAVAPSETDGPTGEEERAALADVFESAEPTRILPGELIGDTAAASATFQLAAVLAAAADDPEARGRAALITSINRDGVLGCALVRIR
jgi:3-oxoacyl-[acyl-carrier-protein] synthase II